MKFLLPQGIGDSVWALHKVQSIAEREGDGEVEIALNCSSMDGIQSRALDFVKNFSFVKSAEMVICNIHPPIYVDQYGRYNYISDGWAFIGNERRYVTMPNGPLERGIRLEDWLPQYQTRWDLPLSWRASKADSAYASDLKNHIGEYCVFFLGSMAGNTIDGHNRGPLWHPQDWVKLAERIQKDLGLSIVVVGAEYDRSYYNRNVVPIITMPWLDLIGEMPITRTFAVTKGARFVVSYQSGIGIFSSYLGVPTAIFWRPKGNSISPVVFLSFEEAMASAWVRPDMLVSGKHLPLIYGRETPDRIANVIKERGW